MSTGLTRVLVIDANPLLAEGMAALFQPHPDFDARTARIGADLVIARDAEDGAALALVDPDLLGASVAQVAGRNPGLALIGYLPPERVAAAATCLASGFRGVLSKSAGMEAILAALHLVARGGVYIDAPFAAGPIARGAEPRQAAQDLPRLSDREMSVLTATARGMSAKEIGQALTLSCKTVETYRARAASKLNLHGRREIIDFVQRSGWISARN